MAMRKRGMGGTDDLIEQQSQLLSNESYNDKHSIPSQSLSSTITSKDPLRISYCTKFKKAFWILIAIWLVYVIGVIHSAIGIHRLDLSSQEQDVPNNSNKKDHQSLHIVASSSSNKETMGKSTRDQLARALQLNKDINVKAPTRPKPTSPHEKPKTRRAGFRPKPYGHMVQPEKTIEQQVHANKNSHHHHQQQQSNQHNSPRSLVLTAYLEQMDLENGWDHETTIKPLPIRTTTAKDLIPIRYPKLSSCSKLPEQWPVDEYTELNGFGDAYLPWIHDVFPTHNGDAVQFVVQNHRRCNTGTTDSEEDKLHHMAPQVSLFQHLPIQRLYDSTDTMTQRQQQQSDSISTTTTFQKSFVPPRYRLSSHEDADPDGIATRFICRFKRVIDNEVIVWNETLSVFNHDYEWASVQKKHHIMFQPHGRDNKLVHTSQLMFQCPVPDDLREIVKTGASVQEDWATIFVDLVPIRTLPRYTSPSAFLQPKYQSQRYRATFDPYQEWGYNHIVPLVEDSGRWENIPICKPSLLQYEPNVAKQVELQQQEEEGQQQYHETNPIYAHKLVNCLWASAGYATRGNRFAINDGQRRLHEWIAFHRLLGFDHVYVYDNTGAFTNETSLAVVADMFPEGTVTIVPWPSRVCNNNPNNVDSVGERSSQYAAETSCRLRFGPHVEWIGQFDIDEYLIPMMNTGKYTNENTLLGSGKEYVTSLDPSDASILPLLDKLDEEGTKIISFASWRAWPRRTHINEPIPIYDNELCGRKGKPGSPDHCFELTIPRNTTFLEAYNCDRQKPGQKSKQMPAEKQIYKASYVKQHFIHYSTVTELTLLTEKEFKEEMIRLGKPSYTRAFPDPKSRFAHEVSEALMLHSKAIARQDTMSWVRNCHANYTGKTFDQCRIGFPWPNNVDSKTDVHDSNGWKYNCYVHKPIDNYLGPLLRQTLTSGIRHKN